MEIERKFTVRKLPENLDSYPCHLIEQAYLNTDPVIRVRRQDDEFYMTYKGKGLLMREEYNLPLNEASYYHLREKADGNIISKKRYIIPIKDSSLCVELDIFDKPFAPLIIAEVEFPDKETAEAFVIDKALADKTGNDALAGVGVDSPTAQLVAHLASGVLAA